MSIVIGEVPRGFGGDTGDMTQSVVIPMPPRNGGGWGWGDSFLSFGADFHDARLRVAVWNDVGNYWRVDSSVIVPQNGGRIQVPLVDGDSKVSVSRKKLNDTDPGTQPVGWLFEIILKA